MIGTPVNNFTVLSTLKAWVAHIVRIRRTFRSTPDGKIGPLRDRPVIVASAHGGYVTVPPGATLEVRTAPGQKGVQVTEILSVDTSTAQQETARRPRPERPEVPPDQVSVEEFGTVKFYAAEKGFGFIVRDRGGKDIFVHASALNRAGINELAEGQRVAVDMVEGGKGPEAVSIRLI